MKIYRNYFKHFIDILLALIGLVLASPLFLPIAICLAYVNKGSFFFLQARPGKEAKIFKVVKFKTMTDEKDQLGKLLPDEKRLTRLGVRRARKLYAREYVPRATSANQRLFPRLKVTPGATPVSLVSKARSM